MERGCLEVAVWMGRSRRVSASDISQMTPAKQKDSTRERNATGSEIVASANPHWWLATHSTIKYTLIYPDYIVTSIITTIYEHIRDRHIQYQCPPSLLPSPYLSPAAQFPLRLHAPTTTAV